MDIEWMEIKYKCIMERRMSFGQFQSPVPFKNTRTIMEQLAKIGLKDFPSTRF
jgi:hypothetical protein